LFCETYFTSQPCHFTIAPLKTKIPLETLSAKPNRTLDSSYDLHLLLLPPLLASTRVNALRVHYLTAQHCGNEKDFTLYNDISRDG
jgi:hypothetical protein